MASIRSIANVLDPVHWPLPDPQNPSGAPSISIRALAGGHRWLGIAPSPIPPDNTTFRPIPDPFSLRSLFNRHEHQATTLSRFLSYNTYLLPGVEIPWDAFINSALVGGIAGVLEIFALTAFEVLVGLDLSVENILRFTFTTLDPLDLLAAFGVSVSSLAEAVGAPAVIGDALEAIIEFVGIGVARNAAEELIIAVANEACLQLTDILALTNQDPLGLLLLVLSKLGIGPTAMLAVMGIHLPGPLGEKPAIRERASEIALATMEGYEIMALSEV